MTTLTLNALLAHGTNGHCEPVEVSVILSGPQTGHGLSLLLQQRTVLLGNMPSMSPKFTIQDLQHSHIQNAYCPNVTKKNIIGVLLCGGGKNKVCWNVANFCLKRDGCNAISIFQ